MSKHPPTPEAQAHGQTGPAAAASTPSTLQPSSAAAPSPAAQAKTAAAQAQQDVRDDVQRERGSDWSYVLRLWPYLARQRGAFWGAMLLYPVNAACVVLPPYFLQQMFDRGLRQADTSVLTYFASLYLLATVGDYVSGFFSEYLTSRVGQRAMASLRSDLFAHVQRLPAAYFSYMPTGRLLTRMTNDVEALSEIFATGAVTILSDLLSVGAIISMMFFLSPKLALSSLLIVPFLVAVAMGFQGYARRAFQEIRRQMARINAFLAEHVGAMSMVQAFGQEQRTQDEFGAHNEAYRNANHRAIFADAALFAIVEAIGTTAVAVTIGYGAHDLARGALTAGVLVAFIQYFRRFFGPIRDLSTKYTILQSAFAAAERTFGLLDAKVTIDDAANAMPVTDFSTALELRNVWFSFDEAASSVRSDADAAAGAEPDAKPEEGPTWVLRGINLTIKKGERVGLVGATGSGKTTLLKLLNRTYDVQRGSVRLDGQDVRDLKLHDVRRTFAPVLQDSTLFTGTLLDNLMLADRIDRASVERALDVVQARTLIAALPNGLDTQVAELGANFSAGERQVLSLARTIALEAPILLMDEATSNVDTPTEARMQAAIDRLLVGRTAVIVAHRLSTIEKVDRIVVLDQGVLVQQGSHQELLAVEGPYRTLVQEGMADAGKG